MQGDFGKLHGERRLITPEGAEIPAGDHVLVLGRVIGGELLDYRTQPMSYRETGAIDGAAALFPDVFEH